MDNTTFKISYSSVPTSMYLGKEKSLSQSRIADVLSAIINAPGGKKIISLVSAYQEEGGAEIAFELASALSSSGKRVLIVDAEAGDTGVYREFRYHIPTSMNASLQNTSVNGYTVLHLENSNVFYSCFCKTIEEKNMVYSPERFAALFHVLRESFDYIFLITEASTGLSIVYSTQISDASIVIVEAERTRRPVVAQLIENIKLNGGNILGLILNKRPFYIPLFLYRLLYK